MIKACITFLLGALVVFEADAVVNTTSVVYTGVGTPVSSSISAPVFVAPNVVTVGASTASSEAYLGLGIIRLNAVSGPADLAYAYASAHIIDQITFASGFGQTAILYWSFHASISPNLGYGSGAPTQASIDLRVGSSYLPHVLTNGVCLSPDRCTILPGGGSESLAGGIPWTITSEPIDIDLGMTAQAPGNNEWADASHTAMFYLSVPAGVQFTSASGTFLSEAAPIPEVGTAGLLAAGLVAILALTLPARQSRTPLPAR